MQLLTEYSVQFNCSVVSDSLRPHESQHAKPPCPSPTPRVHAYLRPSSQWCHPAISSSVVPFSSCPQSLPASESFPMSQLFAWGGLLLNIVMAWGVNKANVDIALLGLLHWCSKLIPVISLTSQRRVLTFYVTWFFKPHFKHYIGILPFSFPFNYFLLKESSLSW